MFEGKFGALSKMFRAIQLLVYSFRYPSAFFKTKCSDILTIKGFCDMKTGQK